MRLPIEFRVPAFLLLLILTRTALCDGQAPTPPQAPTKSVCPCTEGGACTCDLCECDGCPCHCCPGKPTTWQKWQNGWQKNLTTGEWRHPTYGTWPAGTKWGHAALTTPQTTQFYYYHQPAPLMYSPPMAYSAPGGYGYGGFSGFGGGGSYGGSGGGGKGGSC